MSFGSIKTGRLTSLETGHYPEFQTGLDASKTTSPGVGDSYYSTDTMKIYHCYIASLWTLISSPVIEEYYNHTGTVDNYTQIVESGGTSTETAATHSRDISSGAVTGNYANFSTKGTYNLSNIPIIVNFKIAGLVNGATSKNSAIGLRTTFASSIAYEVSFFQEADGGAHSNAWSLRRQNDSGASYDYIDALVNGDIITIIATLTYAIFLKNGTILGTVTTGIPEADKNLYIGAYALAAGDGTARQLNIDMMNIKRFI